MIAAIHHPSSATRFGEQTVDPLAPPGFGGPQAIAGLVVVVALLGTLVLFGAIGAANPGRHPTLFGGSLVLDDHRPLVVVDLATGAGTIRLRDLFAQVEATSYAQVQAVALDRGTMLVNRTTGTFNVLGRDNFALKRAGGGVGLGLLPGSTFAAGFANGASAYVVRYGPTTTVSLVGADTVQAAAGPARTVTPRGFADVGGHVPEQPGAAVTAGGDLWAIREAAAGATIAQFHPDATSHNGLVTVNRGPVDAGPGQVAALEAAPAAPAHGGGGPVSASTPTASWVGLATPGRVRLYPPASQPQAHRDVAVPGTADAQHILPVSGAEGPLWYLAQSLLGWSIFGVEPSTGRVLGPQPLGGPPPTADLIPPQESGGSLYTYNRRPAGQPTLWRITPASGAATTVSGVAAYPQKSTSERADFSGAELTAKGPRVVFNNPDSLLAVVVFTDGSHEPVILDKSAAVDESALSPTASDAASGPATPGDTTAPVAPPAPAVDPGPAPAVSPQVTCQNTTQKPRAPQVPVVTPAVHAALITWSYPLLDRSDCEPTSWGVRVQAQSGRQPSHPIQLVTGQQQVQFGGLRPATRYQVTVTAYINEQSTASAPALFTTVATGPDPPTSVHTTADNAGNWTISWTLCVSDACSVPADIWTVKGTSCGGGFVGRPPSVQVGGGQTSVTLDAGSLHQLGTSMSFQVQGVSASGLTGDPTSDRACTEAWRPPDPAHIKLQASALPAGTAVTATLQVVPAGDPDEVYGSQSPLFTFHVGQMTAGPGPARRVVIPGLAPGNQFQPSVTIIPAHHPEAAVSINGAPFSQTLPWPPMAVAAKPIYGNNPDEATLSVAFHNAPSVPLQASGQITCGSSGFPIGGDLDHGSLAVPFSLASYGGDCQVTATLSEQTPSVYGAPSPKLEGAFAIGTQIDQSTFRASYLAGSPTSYVVVTGQAHGKGDSWSVRVTKPRICLVAPGYSGSSPPIFPLILDLGPCSYGTFVQLTVSWRYLGQTENIIVIPVGPPPPTTTTTPMTAAPAPAPAAALASARSEPVAGRTVMAATPWPAGHHGGADGAVTDPLLAAGVAAGLLTPAQCRRRRLRRHRR